MKCPNDQEELVRTNKIIKHREYYTGEELLNRVYICPKCGFWQTELEE